MSDSIKVKGFRVVGVSVRTTNQEQKGMKDIGALWEQFFADDIREKLTNKLNEEIYSVYSDYEGDFMKPYTCTIGLKVSDKIAIPEGMVEVKIPDQICQLFHANGKLPDAVGREWMKIWELDIDRAYQADFEVYSEKAQNLENAEVDIYIGIT